MKQNYFILISLFFIFQHAERIQASDNKELEKIVEVVRALREYSVVKSIAMPDTIAKVSSNQPQVPFNQSGSDSFFKEGAWENALSNPFEVEKELDKIIGRDKKLNQNNRSLDIKVNFEQPDDFELPKSLPKRTSEPRKISNSEEKYLQATNAVNFRVPEHCAIDVITIPVLNQSSHPWPTGDVVQGLSWSKVAGGEYANCGYHALKNVKEFISLLPEPKALTRAEAESLFSSLKNFESYKNFMQVSAPVMFEFRQKKKTFAANGLNWLRADEVELLAQQFQIKSPVVVIEDVRGISLTEHVLIELKKFLQARWGMLGIIYAQGQQNSHTHWVGFVAVKPFDLQHCKIQLYAMNSGGLGQYYVNEVKQLFSLSLQQIDEMINQPKIAQMQADIETLSNPNRKNPATLQDVVDIVLINWKDYKIPDFIQQQILNLLMIFWSKEITLDTQKVYLCSKIELLKDKLNLVDTEDLQVLCLSME